MKIALCSTYVPFIKGGYRNIVDWLEFELLRYGHKVEKVYLPQVDNPDLLMQQMSALRLVDLSSADKIICFRPQAHLIPHDNKVVWFIHHIRVLYDLWDSPYRFFPDNIKYRIIKEKVTEIDTNSLKEAKKVFSNSKVVLDRLKHFNKISAEVLYPPVHQPERFYCQDFNDEILSVCRLVHHKRIHLLIEAMAYTHTDVKLRICGEAENDSYLNELTTLIQKHNLHERVFISNTWISEEEKINRLSSCLCLAYIPFDEDSYGFPSIEASLSSKPILTTTDSGGVIELVQNKINGYICEPNPQAISEAMDQLYLNKNLTKSLGLNAKHRLEDLDITWSSVVERLLT